MKNNRKIGLILPPDKEYRELEKKLTDSLREKGCEVLISTIGAGEKNAALIINECRECDLLIVLDMAGFEAETLTGGRYYNLMNCKQVHFLLSGWREKERYMNRPLSIAMFFYVAGQENFDRLKTEYEQLPYLKLLEGWNPSQTAGSDNVSAIMAAVEEVCVVCGL